MEGIWKDDGVEVTFINVYSPCNMDAKRRLWGDLISHKENKSWSNVGIIGDINSVRRIGEREGERKVDHGRSERREFNQFLHDMEVEDIPLIR